MTVLYKLTEQYNQVIELADQLDEGTLRDTLDSIEGAFDDKAENIAKSIKEIEGQANMISVEINRLTQRKRTMENNAKSMKRYLQEQMESIGKRKIQGELLTVSVQKNAPSLVIENEVAIPQSFYIHQAPKLDKAQLKAELKDGLEIPGVDLVQTESVRIK